MSFEGAPVFPPGPRMPAVWQTLRIIFRPAATFQHLQRRYGSCFTVRRWPATFVYVSDPADIKQIFKADPETLRAGEGNAILEPVLGSRSVLLLDEPEHMRHRKLLLPPFHGERLKGLKQEMVDTAREHVNDWKDGDLLYLQDGFQGITLDVVLRTVFGAKPEEFAELRSRLVALLSLSTSTAVMLPWLQRKLWPGSPWRRFLKTKAEADKAIYAAIERVRTERNVETEASDVMSLLLQTRDENGVGLSDRELRDELMTLLVAGHETTATALAWTFELLLRHPAALARAKAECCSESGAGEYVEAVIKESLRLSPPIPHAARLVRAPYKLGDYLLPPGVMIAPLLYLTHRNPDIYDQPLSFIPDRFLESKVESYGWLPFGGGTRRCIGASFALMEMKVVIESVLRQVSLHPVVSGPVARTRRRAIVFAPRGGVPVRVSTDTAMTKTGA